MFIHLLVSFFAHAARNQAQVPGVSTPAKVVCKAKLLYTVIAEHPDEISANTGDIVDVLDKETGEVGWWKVTKTHKFSFSFSISLHLFV